MKRKIVTILVLLIFFLKTLDVCSQSDNYICNTDENSIAGYLGLPTHSEEPGKYLRILIIYVTFPDDNLVGPTSTSYENIWLKPDLDSNGTRPLNPYTTDGKLIDTAGKSDSIPFMDRYREYTYSDWFCEMSQGKLDVIGDEIYFRLPYESEHYRTVLNWRRSQLNKWILRYAKDSLHIDFSRYDNWTYSNNVWSWGADSTAEMIAIQFRRFPGLYEAYYWAPYSSGTGGLSNLGFDSTLLLGSTYVRSFDGITAAQGINRVTKVMAVGVHEICHHIFGAHFNHAGFNNGHTSIGFMTEGTSNSTYTMLPMERGMQGLNWITPDTVTSGNVQTTYTLNDFISSGECLKVEIPNTNPKEYFWISNHQKVSKYDGASRGSNECWITNKYEQDPFCDKGKGLFIFHQSADDCPNNINGYNPIIEAYRHFAFDLISSEGKFKWTTDRNVTDQYLGNINIQKVTIGSRDSGVSKFNKYYLQPYPTWSAQLVTDDACSDQSGDYFITGDFHGDGLDAYNVGYDEIFSPYSNPSTRSCQNLSANNGITVNLLSQDTSGAITLKIYYDDGQALLDLPPSKPKNVKATKHFFGGYNSIYFHPEITWDQNIEPDFYNASAYNGPEGVIPKYEIYRGSSTDCEADPTYSLIATLESDVTSFTDTNVTLHRLSPSDPECPPTLWTYSYKVAAKDNRTLFSLKSERAMVSGYINGCGLSEDNFISNVNSSPDKFSVQNYPNPFNPVTKIYYTIPIDGNVKIIVYNSLGQKVMEIVNEIKTAGKYTTEFNGNNFASGIYYYRMESGNFSEVRKMILIK